MLCLTQGKNNSFPVRAGIVFQGKYLGGAFKMVNLFLCETVRKRLLNVFLGKMSVIITVEEAGQVPKPDAFDFQRREGLVSQGVLLEPALWSVPEVPKERSSGSQAGQVFLIVN